MPALSPAKQYVVDHLKYSSHPFYVFEATSKFWLEEGIPSINMDFGDPLIDSIWLESELQVKGSGGGNDRNAGRVILKAFGPSGFAPEQVLAAFRKECAAGGGGDLEVVSCGGRDWENIRPPRWERPFEIGGVARDNYQPGVCL